MLTQNAYYDDQIDVEQDQRQWQDEQREEAWINDQADLDLEINCLSLWEGW